MKIAEYSPCLLLIAVAVALVLVFGKFNTVMLLVAAGAFAVTFSLTQSLFYATISGVVALFSIAGFMKYREGFNTHTPPSDISSVIRTLKATKRNEEGFISQVYENLAKGGYNTPGFGIGAPLVEGFEDEKKPESKSKPAPVEKKIEMAMPFKLGEIPNQVKNGPHIDAGSTLVKAIQGLNPEQINAMTKDTQQLIETQKSLMGMLGTMKPMMKDGKELMETFQQMFGQ